MSTPTKEAKPRPSLQAAGARAFQSKRLTQIAADVYTAQKSRHSIDEATVSRSDLGGTLEGIINKAVQAGFVAFSDGKISIAGSPEGFLADVRGLDTAMKPCMSVMLYQWLVFASKSTVNDDLRSRAHEIFAYFGGDGLENARKSIREFIECMKFAQEANVVLPGAAMSIGELINGLSQSSHNDNASFLEKHGSFIAEICRLGRLYRGYLQVYVRVHPIYEPPSGSCEDGRPFSWEDFGKRGGGKLSVCGVEKGSFADFFAESKLISSSSSHMPHESSNKRVAEQLVDDMQQLRHGKDHVVFGYGYSGSGKSYTLVGTPGDPGIIARALAAFAGSQQDGLSALQLFRLEKVEVEKIMIQGRGANCKLSGSVKKIPMDGDEIEHMTYAMGNEEEETVPPFFKSTKVFPACPSEEYPLTLDGIGRYISTVQEKTEEYLVNTFRIRPTPNNVRSSRVHTWYTYQLQFGGGDETTTSVRLIVVDMAGRESADQILRSFNTSYEWMETCVTTAYPDQTIQDALRSAVSNGKSPRPRLKWGKFSKKSYTAENITLAIATKEIQSNTKRIIERKDAIDAATIVAGATFGEGIHKESGLKFLQNVSEKNSARKASFYVPGTMQAYQNGLGGDWDDRIDQEYSSIRARRHVHVYRSAHHIMAAYLEGVYIHYSLEQLRDFMLRKKGSTNGSVPSVTTAFAPRGASVGTVEPATLQQLNQLADANFIMLAHLRADKPESMEDTLDLARQVSAAVDVSAGYVTGRSGG